MPDNKHIQPERPAPRVSRPSTARYQSLIDALTEFSKAVADGEDPLEASIQTVRSIMTFVTTTADSSVEPPIAILAIIHKALHDVQQGAKTELFENYKKLTTADKPTGLFREFFRGNLASVLDTLIRHGGMKRVEAELWLAKECTLQELHDEKGDPISGNKMGRWRDEVNAGTAPATTRATYQELVEHARTAITHQGDRLAWAQRHAQIAIKIMKQNNPGLPPSNGGET